MNTELFKLMSGTESPLGGSLRDGGCNFSVWAPEATGVHVVLFDNNEKEITRIKLEQKKEGVWSTRLR